MSRYVPSHPPPNISLATPSRLESITCRLDMGTSRMWYERMHAVPRSGASPSLPLPHPIHLVFLGVQGKRRLRRQSRTDEGGDEDVQEVDQLHADAVEVDPLVP